METPWQKVLKFIIRKEKKLVKIKIDIDEKWPIFSAKKVKNDGPYTVEISSDFYKQYLWFCLKYHEFQTQLKEIYEIEKERNEASR